MSLVIDWSNYQLRDLPFVRTEVVNVDVNDERLNGRLFCDAIVSDEIKRLKDLLVEEPNIIYISSGGEVLGFGKSALLARVYWEMRDQKLAAVWVPTTGYVSINSLVAQLYDSLVAYGYVQVLQKALGPKINADSVGKALMKNRNVLRPGLANAVSSVLNSSDEVAARTIANIRRATWVWSVSETIEAILELLKSANKVKNFFFFVDQFEEYALSTPPQRLGNDINDLLRACNQKATIVATMHPDAEKKYLRAGGSYIQSIAPIDRTKVEIPPLDGPKAVVLARFYLERFRLKGYQGDQLYPFSEDVLLYLRHKAKGNTRDYLNSMRNSFMQGARLGYVPIDDAFISNQTNHDQVLGKTPNEWAKFKKSVK